MIAHVTAIQELLKQIEKIIASEEKDASIHKIKVYDKLLSKLTLNQFTLISVAFTNML